MSTCRLDEERANCHHHPTKRIRLTRVQEHEFLPCPVEHLIPSPMPYIPPFGPDGTALDPVHASLQHTVSRVRSSLQGILPEHHALMPRGLGNYNSVNASAIFDMNQQRTRQIVATTSSTLSLASALMAVLWFFMMRRNFRRDLVLLLILGGAFKSLWFVVFSVYSFVHGPVQTASGFCQANGYLLQVGFEQCGKSISPRETSHIIIQSRLMTRYGRRGRPLHEHAYVLPDLSHATLRPGT